MSRYRSQGLLAVGLGLAATACSSPDLATDLRPAGPPDVLAVLTQNPLDLIESAVKCKYVGGKRDPKGPAFVGDPLTGGSMVCPEDEADFEGAQLEPRPLYTLNTAGQIIDTQVWGLRVMFDELLDPDKVETLECDDLTGICAGTLEETSPIKLTCGAMNTEVAYTGYYVPNGNNTTFPLGPSLYVLPNADDMNFATGTTCNLTIDGAKVTDKDGVAPPDADLVTQLKIADLKLLSVDPEDGTDAVISPDPVAAGAAAFVFNANLESDPDTGAVLDPAMFQLKDGTGADIDTFTFVGAYNSAALTDAVYVFPDTTTGVFLPGDYTATMKAGEMTEVNGGSTQVTETKTDFSVAFGIIGQTPSSVGGVRDLATSCGMGVPGCSTGSIRVRFNNTVDMTTVGAEDLELFQTNSTPANRQVAFTTAAVTSPAVPDLATNNAIEVRPSSELELGTYVLRVKANAEIKDTAGTPHVASFRTPVATTYSVLLKITHIVPAAAGTPAIVSLPRAGNFDIVFSGSLDFSSVGAAEFELTDLTTMQPVPITIEMATSASRTPPLPGSHANDTVRINPNADLTAGRMYRMTMKPGTQLKSAATANTPGGISRTFATATTWTITAI